MSFQLKQSFAPIANANYDVKIISSEEVGGDHPHFMLKLQLQGSNFANRVIFHRLWFSSETPELAEKLMSLAVQCFNVKIKDDEVTAESFIGCIGNVALEQYSFIGKNGEDQTNSRIARYNLA